MADADRRKWDARYREQGGRSCEPCSFLSALTELLPRQGRALDVAGGIGRSALWLAECGLDTTVSDISPVALGIAREEAGAAGLALRTLAIDFESERFPPGPWDLILCVRCLWRPLFEAFSEELAPNGLLVVVHPTRSNLERHSSPGPHHLLDDGELPGLISALEVVHYEEGWSEEGRHEARLVARRRGQAKI
jgi:tellurite methyltransferase